MSSEIQLVLIGGLIAILSSISTAVLTSILGYWLESRKEKRKIKLETSRSLGRLAGLEAENREDRKWIQEYEDLLKELRKDDGTLEELAAAQGLVDAFAEIIIRKHVENGKKAVEK